MACALHLLTPVIRAKTACAAAAGGHNEASPCAPAAPRKAAAASLAALQLKQRQLWSGAQADNLSETPTPNADQSPQPYDSRDNDPLSAPLCASDCQALQAIQPSAADGSLLTSCDGHVTVSACALLPTADRLVDHPPADQTPGCAIATSEKLLLQAATVAASLPQVNDSCSQSPKSGVQSALLDSSQGTSCARRDGALLGASETIGSSGGSPGRAVGRELFITGSFFNHSCAPNCIIHRRGAFGFVFTQADVKVRLSQLP